jgi:hypothetical protein
MTPDAENPGGRLTEAGQLVSRLIEMVGSESDKRFLPGLNLLRRYADEGSLHPESTLVAMRELYAGMQGGYGSFSDFFYWRDDFEERRQLNQEFENVRIRLQELLG